MADETLDSLHMRTMRQGKSRQAWDAIVSRNNLDANLNPIAEPEKQQAGSTAAHQAGTQGRIEKIQAAQKAEKQPSFLRDVVGGTIAEIPRAIIGGATAVTKELLESADSLASYFESVTGLKKGGGFGKVAGAIPEMVGENQTPGGNLLRGITQVAGGYVAGGKLLKGVTAAAGAGKVTAAMVKGAFADAAAFDPKDPTLSNWVVESFPGLKDSWVTFLATDPKDGEALNRFKRAAEGLGVGALLDTVVAVARNARARWALQKVEAAATKAKAAPAAGPEPRVPMEGIDPVRPATGMADDIPDTFEGMTPSRAADEGLPEFGGLTERQLKDLSIGQHTDESVGRILGTNDPTAKLGTLRNTGILKKDPQSGLYELSEQARAKVAPQMDESVVDRMMKAGEATEAEVRVASTANRIEASGVDPTVSRDLAEAVEKRMVEVTEEMRLIRGAVGDRAVTVGEYAEQIEREFMAREAMQRANETVNQTPEAMKYLKARLRREDLENPIRGNPTLRAAYETSLRGESEEAMTRQIIDKERRAMEEILKDEGGEISREAVHALARASVGGAIGFTQGETMEERIVMALGTAALGVALKPSSIKKVIDIFRRANPRQAAVIKSFDPPDPAKFQGATKTGMPRRPVKPTEIIDVATPAQMKAVMDADPSTINLGKKALKIDWQNVDTEGDLDDLFKILAKENEGVIDEARRGVISRDMTKRLANLIGTTEQDILSANPGLALNAEQTKSWIDIVGSAMAETNKLAHAMAAGQPVEAQFRLMLGRSSGLLQKLYGVRAEWGRAGGIWATMADTVGARAKTLSQEIALLSVGGKTLDQIPAEKLAQMVMELGDPAKQATFLHHATQMGKSALLEAWINGLLSNPVTHAVNTVSNAMVMATGVIERRIAENFGNGVARGEAAAMMNGMLGAWDDALSLAKLTFKENRPHFGQSKLDYRPGGIQEIADAVRETAGPLGKAVDLLGAFITSPGRALMAADDFFKAFNYRGELHAQAWRQAAKEGLSGDALRAQYKSLATDANFASLVKDQAEDFAAYQTFNNALGPVGLSYLGFLNEHPLLRVVTPFVRTPVNITKFSLERAPVINLTMSKYRADLAAGGARRDLALAKMTFGGLVMGTGLSLGFAGMITGPGPKDKDLLAAKRLTGWQPYSIKIPWLKEDGRAVYVSYNRFDPLGVLLGLWGSVAEKAGELNEVDIGTLATAAVVGFTDTLMQKTYLKGIKDVFDLLTDVEQREERYLQRLAGSLVPAGLAALTRQMDPTIKEINSIQDAIYSRLPGNDVPARRNLKGEKIELEGGLGPDMISPFQVSSEKPDPVADELIRLDLGISLPDKFIFGRRPRGSVFRQPDPSDGVRLLPDEYDRYAELAGNGLKIDGKGLWDRLTEDVQSEDYKNSPDEIKENHIRSIFRNYREAARAKIIEEFPDLQQAVGEKQVERSTARAAIQPMR